MRAACRLDVFAWFMLSGIVLLSGCRYRALPEDGAQQCGPEGSKRCPDGYTCENDVARGVEVCRRNTTTHDGGIDAPGTPPRPTGDSGAACTGSQMACGGGRCVDLQSDPTNCGMCGKDCSLIANVDTAVCRAGLCVVEPDGCVPGFAHCSQDPSEFCETDVTTPERCGSCSNTCTGDKPNCSSTGRVQSCSATCGGTTPDQCGAQCVNLKTDPRNCGACSKPCALDNAESTCTAGSCEIVKCNPGYADCTPAPGCETPIGTTANCGKCGDSCEFAGATSTCMAGKCSAPVCQPGFANCDATKPDCETQLGSAQNCMACGQSCTAANPICASAAGAFSCVSDCTAAAPDKCEGRCLNFKTDPTSCGSCGNKCSFPNAAGLCVDGKCVQGACAQGFGDCSPETPGCETPLGTNANCSKCKDSCEVANALSSCNGSTCSTPVCRSGFANCDKSNPDCETPIGTTANCKGCNDACGAATPVCSGSGTNFACASDCTASAPDKCQTACVNLKSDRNNCGTCGRACNYPNGEGFCNNGTCELKQCTSGYADCTAADGCETKLGTDAHCSGCNKSCTTTNGTSSCNGTMCTAPVCNSGWAKCPGQTGCDTQLGTTTNCGGCGEPCGEPTPVCSRSGSSFSCVSGCSASAPNRCGSQCVNVTSDVNHCGGCNTKCTMANASATCTNGSCAVAACNSGFAHCSGPATAGCETQLGTNTNCARCGNACGSQSQCTNGHCDPIDLSPTPELYDLGANGTHVVYTKEYSMVRILPRGGGEQAIDYNTPADYTHRQFVLDGNTAYAHGGGFNTPLRRIDVAAGTGASIGTIAVPVVGAMRANATHIFVVAGSVALNVYRYTKAGTYVNYITADGIKLSDGYEVDDQFVYFMSADQVRKVPVDNSSASSLVVTLRDPEKPRSISRFGSYLYFASADRVGRVPLNGGAAETIATGGGTRVLADASHVYWFQPRFAGQDQYNCDGGSRLMKAANTPGATATELGDDSTCVVHAAQDATGIFWYGKRSSSAAAAVRRADK